MTEPPITLLSCSNATAAHAGAVIVSGCYGGKYNAFNAAKWDIRGVIMNDAGVGADHAGIIGLPYLDQIGLPAATAPPPITEGIRVILRDVPGQPRLIWADSVGMVRPEDAGHIVITASHAALPGGRPDTLIPPGIYAVFFSDAGVGLDTAGIARLPVLDAINVIAGTTSAASAPIGDAQALYHRVILSHVTSAADRAGASVGMPLKAFVERLLES